MRWITAGGGTLEPGALTCPPSTEARRPSYFKIRPTVFNIKFIASSEALRPKFLSHQSKIYPKVIKKYLTLTYSRLKVIQRVFMKKFIFTITIIIAVNNNCEGHHKRVGGEIKLLRG